MAISRMQLLKARLPEWVQDWLEVIIPGSQILLILVVAWLLQRTLRRLVRRASAHYQLPDELLVPINGLIRWLIIASALLLVLERMGVSATVLWTAFMGFATVGAVAFFAAWSVLSNLFLCAAHLHGAAFSHWELHRGAGHRRQARRQGPRGGYQSALHHAGGPWRSGGPHGVAADSKRSDLSARGAPV